MRKNIYFYTSVLVVGISFFALKKANGIQAHNTNNLSTILTLAVGENNGPDSGENGSDENSYCKTISDAVWEQQTCNGQKVAGKITIKNKCDGKSTSGNCITGNEYIFYDCEGVVISRNDYTELTVCF